MMQQIFNKTTFVPQHMPMIARQNHSRRAEGHAKSHHHITVKRVGKIVLEPPDWKTSLLKHNFNHLCEFLQLFDI